MKAVVTTGCQMTPSIKGKLGKETHSREKILGIGYWPNLLAGLSA